MMFKNNTKQEPAAPSKPTQPIVLRGRMRIDTDEEIAAKTTPEAMKARAVAAAENFQEHAPREFKTLLDAKKPK